MKRLVPLVIVLALAAAACGSASDVAASVNGSEIAVERVEEFAGSTFEDAPGQFNQALNTLVTWEITEQAAEEQFGYVPSDAEIDEQIQEVLDNAGYASIEEMAETQQVSVNTLLSYVTLLMTQDAIVQELDGSVTDPSAEEIESERTTDPASWTTVCAAHILTATEEEATNTLARIEGGEEFAAVATEVSTDTGSGANGGDLGCDVAARYVQAFADATLDAPVGEIVGPVQSEFGFHLILVSDRTSATDDEIRMALRDRLLTDAIDRWYVAAAEDAEVVVEEPYGRWETDPIPQVVPS